MAHPRRPGALLAIAIIGLVLGSLGGCLGLFGVVTPIFQETMQAKQRELQAQSNLPPEMLESQRATEEAMNAVTRKWMPFTVTHQALNLLLSLALVGACILLLLWSPKAPLVFFVAVLGNLVVDVLGAVLGALVQRDSMDAMKQMVMDPAMTGPGASPEAARIMEGVLGASAWMGVCVAGVLVLVKLTYYASGALYLRKPETMRLFTPAPPHAPSASLRGDLL